MADIRIIPSDGLVNVTGSINFKGTGGSTMLFMTGSSGNIGIGTTNPTDKIHMYGSAADQFLKLENTSTYTGLWLQDSGTNNGWLVLSGYTTAAVPGDFAIREYGVQTSLTIKQTTGNIGIGNTAPNQKLELSVGSGVTGGLRINYAASATGEGMDITYLNNGDTTTSFDSRYNSNSAVMQFRMKTAGTAVTAMTILGNGNVGIGTTSPATKLQVNGTFASNALWTDGSSIGYWGAYPTAYGYLTWDTGYAKVAATGTKTLYLGDDNQVTILDGGNVGIGTTSPTQLLEGYTSTNGDISIQITNPSTGASATAQFFASNGTNRTQFFHTGTSYNGTGVLASAAGLGGIYNNTAQGIALLASSAAGPIKFATTTSNTERMRIASDGNVGIGSTSPGKTLDVVGAIRASTAVSASAGIHIKSDGSADSSWDALTFRGTTEWGDASAYGVLGGDASEGIMLRRPHIVWSSVQSDAAIRLGRSGGSSGGDWFGVGVAASNVFFIRRSITTNSVLEVDTNGNMALGAGSDYLYVRQGGNVGVGTTNPSNKFQVVGGVTATSFTGSLLGNATSASFASTAPYSGLTGTVPTWNQNTTGTADYATYLYRRDIRAIAPNDETSGTARFGFTSWGNNNTSPYADFLHLRSYTDASGGSDNLVMFLKSGIGMRIWQQSWNSGTDYSSYKDVAFTDSNITGNAATATTASFATTAATAATATSATSATTATTATNVAWTGVTAGRRTNYDLGFEAPSTGYAGFSFTTPGGAAENAGFFLIRGGADNDVYTQNGITLVADAGWLTLAQRTTAGKGVRIMTGTTSTERLTVLEGGNVGIGTTSPAAKLHVSGSDAILRNAFIGEVPTYTSANAQFSHINRAGAGEYSFLSATDGETYINSKTGYNINFRVNNSNVAIITSAGRVGIGATDPLNKLEVRNGGSSPGYSGNDIVFSNSYGKSAFYHDNGGYVYWYSDLAITFYPGASRSVTFATNGNVGIGTSVPVAKLHVSGSSGSLAFNVEGSQGQLFSVTDSLSGSLMSVNDISGLPILEVFSDDRVIGGKFGSNALSISGSNVGIGAYNPARKLDVYDAASQIVAQFSSSNATSVRIKFSDANTGAENVNIGAIGTRMAMWTNNAERVSILSGGSVGIGTTNPAYKLDVVGGDVRIMNTSGPTLNFSDNVDQNWDMGVDASLNDFYIKNGISGVRHLTVKTGGNVGIGTTSPLFNLQVGANAGTIATTTIRLQNSYLDTNGYYGFNIDAVDNGVDGHDLRFLGRTSPTSGFSELVRIKNSGNVGIGTVSPQSPFKLDVVGPGRFNYYIRLHDGSNPWDIGALFNYTNSDLFFSMNGSEKMRVNANGQLCIGYSGANATGGNSLIAAGNVGIGTTSPSSQLHINTAGSSAFRVTRAGASTYGYEIGGTTFGVYDYTNSVYRWRADGNNVILAESNGNVGIGTTNPGFKLDVSGSIRTLTGYIQGANSSADITIDGNIGTLLRYGTQKLLLNSSNAILYTADAIRLFIDNAGLVGIGTSSPTHLLHVSGGGIRIQGTGNAANSLRFDDTGGTSRNAMYVSSSNYLVVGNTNYAGLQLIHTGSAPARYDGNNIDGYYGDTDGGRSYMSGPDNWLAVRINNTNFVIPMYQV